MSEKEAKSGTDASAAAVAAAAAGSGTPATPPAIPATAGTPDAKPEVKPDAPKAGAPDTYELKLPEHAVLDSAAVERTVAIARARGLSNDDAQAALELANTEAATAVQAARDSVLAAHQPGGAEWTRTVDRWRLEATTDLTLGKTPEERQAAIQRGHGVVERYAKAHPVEGAAFKSFLNDSGLGDAPQAVRFLAWLGKSASDGSFVQPNAEGGGGQARLADLLYGGSMPQAG